MGLHSMLGISPRHRYTLTMKRVFRSREKVLIILVLITFLIVCIGPIFFFPDLKSNFSDRAGKAYSVYKEIQKAAPELILPPPPAQNVYEGYIRDHDGIRNRQQRERDVHIKDDIERLQEKINNDVLEKPLVMKPPDKNSIQEKESNILPPIDAVEVHGNRPNLFPDIDEKDIQAINEGPLLQGGEDSDLVARERREKVKEMTLHAWRGYKAYAWGKNELKPVSKRGHAAGIFGSQDMGATIVDALDTLYIMGLMDEFEDGKKWVQENLDFGKIRSEMSVFETNIRFIGGLLTCYSFTGDDLFKEKAAQIAQRLLPAFETPTGIPYALINIANGMSKNYAWASGGASILSEFGTLHLEFVYLTDITGNPIFKEKVFKIRQLLNNIQKPNGLYPNYLNPKTGKWGQRKW